MKKKALATTLCKRNGTQQQTVSAPPSALLCHKSPCIGYQIFPKEFDCTKAPIHVWDSKYAPGDFQKGEVGSDGAFQRPYMQGFSYEIARNGHF